MQVKASQTDATQAPAAGRRCHLLAVCWSVSCYQGNPCASRADRPVTVALLACAQVSQTDYKEDGSVFGSVLNHVTDGRWATGTTAAISY